MDKKDLEAISQIVNSAIEGSNKELKEEISHKMLVFEHDYGKKIDAIFDVSVMQKDKVREVYKNQEKFRIQVDNLETKVFELDQRVFKLEHS